MTSSHPTADTAPDRGRFLRTWGLALLVLALLGLWMLSGAFRGDDTGASAESGVPPADARFRVLVQHHRAQTIEQTVRFSGDTRPARVIRLAAQAEGQILAVEADEGARLPAAAPVARIDARDLEARHARAQALLHQRELEFRAAGPLRDDGIITEAEYAAAIANRDAARAELANIELQLKNVRVRAPAAGILEQRLVEVGDYVKIGSPVAEILVNDPLTVSGGVGENDIALVEVGQVATATLADGRRLQGVVRFVASRADPSTRTFTVEVAVDNPEARIPAGLSAQVTIPVRQIRAHRIPSALLTLSDDGVLGVKSVDADGVVHFHATDIVRADGDAIWVSGLPETLDLITRGQGFVQPGETVAVARDDAG